MNSLKIGLETTKVVEVKHENTAIPMGGEIEVFGTPYMLGLAEDSACGLAREYLDKEFTTVGTWVKMKHKAPTPIGMHITCHTVLTEIDGNALTFISEFSDEQGNVGSVEHGRYIVNKEDFTKKALGKKVK